MIRAAVSAVGGFILMFVEVMIVISYRENSMVQFDGFQSFINVWAMNFFLLFTILTHIKIWLDNRKIISHS